MRAEQGIRKCEWTSADSEPASVVGQVIYDLLTYQTYQRLPWRVGSAVWRSDEKDCDQIDRSMSPRAGVKNPSHYSS